MRHPEPTLRWTTPNRWLAVGHCLLVALAVLVPTLAGNGVSDVRLVYFSLLPAIWMGPSLHVLADGLMVVARPRRATEWIPLHTLEMQERGSRWLLRWSDGRRRPSLSIRRDPAFDPALGQALEAALAARAAAQAANNSAEHLPASTKEAIEVVTLGRYVPPGTSPVVKLAFANVVLLILAAGFRQPLLLLPTAAIPLLLVQYAEEHMLVLTATDLWKVSNTTPPVRIPLSEVTGVERGNILTNQAGHRAIRIIENQNADLVRRLRSRSRA
ncbi:MAG TPA: hypothetical protein VD902_21075 [Symbiobacteriaceae bacterium]|nr:hypothetical protein [Symbiobacteriaceae bacterium]